MNESALDVYYGKFRNGDENVIKNIWDGIKGATKLYHSYRTPCLTLQDLEQVGLLGTFHGLKKFNPEKGMKLRTWLIQICNQRIVRELNSYNTPNTVNLSNIAISSEPMSTQDITDMLMLKFTEVPDYEPQYISDEFYFKAKTEVANRLYKCSNRMVYIVFNFILENPGHDHSFMFNNLDISSTSYRKYLKQIEETVREVINDL